MKHPGIAFHWLLDPRSNNWPDLFWPAGAGQGSFLPHLKRQVDSQSCSQLRWRLKGCAKEEHLGGLPEQALSSQREEVARLGIHADRRDLGQAQADYSLCGAACPLCWGLGGLSHRGEV